MAIAAAVAAVLSGLLPVEAARGSAEIDGSVALTPGVTQNCSVRSIVSEFGNFGPVGGAATIDNFTGAVVISASGYTPVGQEDIKGTYGPSNMMTCDPTTLGQMVGTITAVNAQDTGNPRGAEATCNLFASNTGAYARNGPVFVAEMKLTCGGTGILNATTYGCLVGSVAPLSGPPVSTGNLAATVTLSDTAPFSCGGFGWRFP